MSKEKHKEPSRNLGTPKGAVTRELTPAELVTQRSERIINKDLYAACVAGTLVDFQSTVDPTRTLQDLVAMGQLMSPPRKVISWTTAQPATNVATGKPIAQIQENQVVKRTTDPTTGATREEPETHVTRSPIANVEDLFKLMLDNKEPTIFYLPNWHLAWGEGTEGRRALVDMFSAMWDQLGTEHKTIVMQRLRGSYFPEELLPLTIPVQEKPVTRDERAALVRRAVVQTQLSASEDAIKAVIDATTGLNVAQTEQALRTGLAKDYSFGPGLARRVMEYKKAQLETGGIWTDITSPEVPELVGWERLFHSVAADRSYGVFKEGSVHNKQLLVLIGQAGTGKTTAVQQIGKILGWPVFKGEVSAMMGHLMGQTEKGMKRAVDEIYAAAPCVALLDEGQRGLQSNDQTTGGGTMNRAVQAILEGIERGRVEGRQVLWVITGNEKDTLPVELFSRGQVWAVNFPDPATCVNIFESIYKRFSSRDPRMRKDPALTSTDIVLATKGYAGRDIEKLISEAVVRGNGVISLQSLLDAREVVVSQQDLDPGTVAKRAKELSRYPSVGSVPGSGEVFDRGNKYQGTDLPRSTAKPALNVVRLKHGKKHRKGSDDSEGVSIRVE